MRESVVEQSGTLNSSILTGPGAKHESQAWWWHGVQWLQRTFLFITGWAWTSSQVGSGPSWDSRCEHRTFRYMAHVMLDAQQSHKMKQAPAHFSCCFPPPVMMLAMVYVNDWLHDLCIMPSETGTQQLYFTPPFQPQASCTDNCKWNPRSNKATCLSIRFLPLWMQYTYYHSLKEVLSLAMLKSIDSTEVTKGVHVKIPLCSSTACLYDLAPAEFRMVWLFVLCMTQ